MKEGLHDHRINKTMRSLVIHLITRDGEWVNEQDPEIIDERKRMSWWVSQIREDESVLW